MLRTRICELLDIGRVDPAAEVVEQVSRDAEAILRERLPRLLA